MGKTPRNTAPREAPPQPLKLSELATHKPQLPAVLVETLARERSGPLRVLGLRAGEFATRRTDQLAALLEREREAGSAFNFVPVFLGLGIACYYLAPAEPVFAVVLASFAIVSFLAWRRPVHGVQYFALVAAAMFLAGMAAAQLRTISSGGAVVAVETTTLVRGLVLGAEANRKGGVRYLIRPLSIAGLTPEQMPLRLRLTAASKHEWVDPGGIVEGTARLQPFSGPAFPGGFDFGFFNWFDGLGATGFFMGAPHGVAGITPASIAEQALMSMNRLRMTMTDRIRAAVGGEAGDICAALITGERMAVDEATEESFRRSGLAHILSISGLHMVLVTLTVVSLLRFILALSPRLALNYPIRKFAVAGGFVSATFYLFLSGAEVATQRSYLMIAVMLVAMLIDRRAMTMRNVALAALIILVMTPEAVLEPGFQMSFAAASALVAGYSALGQYRQGRMARHEAVGPRFGYAGAAAAHVGGLIFTSLVAGLATGLFAAWHFHRVAPMGLVANLIASPVISVVMMPAALGSVLLMPYGLEKLALVPMGWSVDVVVAISDWVNQFPVVEATGKQSLALLASGASGFLMLILLKTKLRLAGLLPIAAMALFASNARPPDLIVSQSGKAAGMADAQGRLALLYSRRDRFIADIWQKAWPHGGEGDAASLTQACDKDHCIAISPGGVRVELVYKPDLLDAACESADILIAPRLRFVDCDGRKPALVIKREDFDAKGVHLIHFNGKGSFTVETGIEPDNRPWNLARKPPPFVYKPRAEKPPMAISSGESAPPADPEPSPGPD